MRIEDDPGVEVRAKSPVRVLFLITTLGVGGAEAQLSCVAQGLASRGWLVKILVLHDLPQEVPKTDVGTVETVPLGARGRLGMVAAMRRLTVEVRRFEADVVVTLLLQANVIGRLVGLRLGVPVVSSIRNTRFGGPTRLGACVGDWLERVTGPASVVTIINSKRAADALVKRRVVSADRMRVIPNAVANWGYRPGTAVLQQARDELRLTSDAFIWVTAGRLEPQKNLDTLLRAFARLRSEFEQVHLVIAGDGTLRSDLERLSDALGLTPATSFLGVRRDLARVMAVADAFVLASRWEGMPNVVLESLALAIPTVATAVGGVPELIDDGVDGWLASSPDLADLHAAMRTVMLTPAAERKRVGRAGRAFVHDHHSPDEVVEAWQRTLRDVIAGEGLGPP